jgi:hypothetical protein
VSGEEPSLAVADDPVAVVDDPSLELVVDPLAGVEEAVRFEAASAGSWPETSAMVISSHAATNSATAPATTRRRINRARRARSSRGEAFIGVMGCLSGSWGCSTRRSLSDRRMRRMSDR